MRRLVAPAAILVFVASVNCTPGGTELRQGSVPARVTILAPDPLILDISAPFRVSTHVYDASGALLDGSVRTAWSSTDTTVAQIDSTGTLYMRRLGSSFIRASVSTDGTPVRDSVELDVIIGQAVQRIPPRPHP
jgi:hypothetical protein